MLQSHIYKELDKIKNVIPNPCITGYRIVMSFQFLNCIVGMFSKARSALIVCLACLPTDYFGGLFLNVFLYRLQDLSGPAILLWVVLFRQLEAKFRF